MESKNEAGFMRGVGVLNAFLASALGRAVVVLFLSMVPIIELRGAIPVGVANGFGFIENLLLCCIGNMIPIPFVILFIRKLFAWFKDKKIMYRAICWVENHVLKKEYVLRKYSLIGLCILVAIPLPGTGAWTGAMLAGLLNMRLKQALPSIALGVLIAGLIVCGVSYGAVGVAGLFGL